MATIISNSPIPGLKISKVGNSRKKKKKGGGLFGFGSKATEEAGSLVRARAATSVLSAGASPALGAAARAALPLGAKIFMGLMLGIAGFGVYSARQAFNHRPVIPAVSPRVFAPRPAPAVASPQAEASPQNLPGDNQGYSSLNMVRTGLPEMQAPPAAPAQAAAAPPPAQPSSPAIPDMSALTQAAKAAKGGNGGSPFDSKIGQLSGAMPSLSGGGPGLSGGVGMPFQKMNPPAFLQKPKPMAMAQTAPSMGMAHGAGFGGVGHAFSQARNAAAYGNAAANSNGAGAAYNSGAQFDSPIGQPATMGSPQGIGSGSGLLGAADASPSTNPNGSGQPSSGGGGGYGNSNYCPGCIPGGSGGGTNVTPWGGLTSIGGYLLMAAGLLVLTASLIAKTPPWGSIIAEWLGSIGAALAAAAVVIGTMIMAQGQTLQGLMFVIGGGLLVWGGINAALNGAQAAAAANANTQVIDTNINDMMSGYQQQINNLNFFANPDPAGALDPTIPGYDPTLGYNPSLIGSDPPADPSLLISPVPSGSIPTYSFGSGSFASPPVSTPSLNLTTGVTVVHV